MRPRPHQSLEPHSVEDTLGPKELEGVGNRRRTQNTQEKNQNWDEGIPAALSPSEASHSLRGKTLLSIIYNIHN
jgi:hypothetical protein